MKPFALFDCAQVDAFLGPYLSGEMPAGERRAMRLHVHRCRTCFDKVIGRDPLQLFAPLADETPSGRTWDSFWPAIREAIERERRAPDRAAVPVPRFAAAAAALVMAGAVALSLVGRPAPEQPMASARAAGVAAPSPLPQIVELVRTPDAREVQIYSMAYLQDRAADRSSPPPVTELVLIVDAGLDL